MKTEKWKDIKGYEGHYQISSNGNVKSLKFNKNRILKSPENRKGYLIVGLFKNGTGKIQRVQRLVAKHFIPNPDNKLCVNHKNGIKTNNRVENLEWVTNQENITHAIENGLYPTKINCEIAKEIRELYATKSYSQRKVASKYNLSHTTICEIVNYKTWKHVI